MTWSSCEHCKSSAAAGRFLEGKASKMLDIFFILGKTLRAKNLQDDGLVALSQVPGECHGS